MGHSAVANQAKSVPRSNVLLTVKLQSRDVRSTEADIYFRSLSASSRSWCLVWTSSLSLYSYFFYCFSKLEKGEFEGIPVNSASKFHYLGTFQNLVWTVWLQN